MSGNGASGNAATFGFWTISALVLLRLAVGWHFYTEGLKKLEPGFSSVGLLSAAKGPLAPMYHAFVPKPGDYDNQLATARPAGSLTESEEEENAEWAASFGREPVADRVEDGAPAWFTPHTAYSAWAFEVAESWDKKRQAAASLVGDDEAADVFAAHLQQLSDYLSAEGAAIEEYRHELWRLETMRSSPGAVALSFEAERIADKANETNRTSQKWWREVATLEQQYVAALAALADDPAAAAAKLRTPSALDWINPTVTCVVLGVGVCMLLGLCTRFAAAVGALFLLSVMATQPPWIPETDATYLGYQLVEVGAMLVLGVTAAGRWYGLDSVLRRCCSMCCGPAK